MAYATFLRVPRPKSFLYLMSLRTGTELITLTHGVNKLTGFYGILSIFTGIELSSLQLSMYIYSIIALVFTVLLAPHIRQGSKTPLHVMGLAWLYVLDSIINAAYTAAFAVSWFMILTQHNTPSDNVGNGSIGLPGEKMINDAAGFTDPEYNVSHVEVAASTATGLTLGQAGTLVGHPVDASSNNRYSSTDAPPLHKTLLQSGSIASVSVIVGLWAVRVYFIFIMLAYARACLRRYIADTSMTAGNYAVPATPSKPAYTSAGTELADNPFAVDAELGSGWKGKFGRTMVALFPKYWLGPEEGSSSVDAEEWNRFGREERQARARGRDRDGEQERSRLDGLGERERRRRAGTDPPVPQLRPLELDALKGGR